MTRNNVKPGPHLYPSSRSNNEKLLYEWKWMKWIESLALSRFKWEGLPKSMSERHLERTLYFYGQAVIFEMDGLAMGTQVVPRGMPNQYDDYTLFTSVGHNGWNYEIPEGNGFMVYDSMNRSNKIQTLRLFASELAELEILQRVNLRQQRTTVVFTGPEEAQNDMVKLAKDLEVSEYGVLANKKLKSGVDVQAIRTNVPFLQGEFNAAIMAKLTNLYAFLGIEQLIEKAERLITAEADAGSDAIARIREDALMPRREAAEAFNEKFGTNITVAWRVDEQNELVADPEQPAISGKPEQKAIESKGDK
jgi:hypothetical protein